MHIVKTLSGHRRRSLFVLFSNCCNFESRRFSCTMSSSSTPYNYSYIFKYIIIGDMGVGKSCLLHQFTEKKCKCLLKRL